ncbi:nitrous oxide reductase accessory protein NosL [Halorarius halobius]|uniref:nitrous oxide reductase accessory protein NosL n=1 Tax=Halorarius halobius TaxID=2962671 RepID=UPI0020CBEA3B|nr:nitrous oxide reductase accessory protein NosL [Halorarius halobius]
MCDHTHDLPLSRRRVLAAGATLAVGATAGCSGLTDDGGTPAAVAVGSDWGCDQCGMVISQHPGPNGEVFFESNSPEGHDNPARFDALKSCLFPYLRAREREGWTAAAVYVTDYSAVDYEIRDAGDPTISSHTDAASFADARELWYVVESDLRGAMGRDFVPFSSKADAESAAAEYGGRVVAYDDIGPALLGD